MLELDTEGGRGRGQWWRRTQREAGSRSKACSEGGRVKVDGGNTIMTKSLMKRMAVTRFEAVVEAAACSGAGDEATACSEVGIKDGRWWWRRGSF
jgi:hypothetical protein